jgi:hypothetical protein
MSTNKRAVETAPLRRASLLTQTSLQPEQALGARPASDFLVPTTDGSVAGPPAVAPVMIIGMIVIGMVVIRMVVIVIIVIIVMIVIWTMPVIMTAVVIVDLLDVGLDNRLG